VGGLVLLKPLLEVLDVVEKGGAQLFQMVLLHVLVLDVAVPDVGKSQFVMGRVGADRSGQATDHHGGGRDVPPDGTPDAVGTLQSHFDTSRIGPLTSLTSSGSRPTDQGKHGRHCLPARRRSQPCR
jgi:hypothetical protein